MSIKERINNVLIRWYMKMDEVEILEEVTELKEKHNDSKDDLDLASFRCKANWKFSGLWK